MLLIILVQDFCPLKIKITQCPGGFRLHVCCFDSKLINHCGSKQVAKSDSFKMSKIHHVIARQH